MHIAYMSRFALVQLDWAYCGRFPVFLHDWSYGVLWEAPWCGYNRSDIKVAYACTVVGIRAGFFILWNFLQIACVLATLLGVVCDSLFLMRLFRLFWSGIKYLYASSAVFVQRTTLNHMQCMALCKLVLIDRFCLRFNGHFPGEPVLAGV